MNNDMVDGWAPKHDFETTLQGPRIEWYANFMGVELAAPIESMQRLVF